MGSFSNTPNFDNLLLQSLMGRRQTPATSPSFLNQTLEDILFDSLNLGLSDTSDDEENPQNNKTQLEKEESKLEKEIIKVILSGKIESLKPNSGLAVEINNHYMCVGFHQEADDSGYRVWEWHGHIMLFDDENGYSPEYIYGNYFERVRDRGVRVREIVEEKEDDVEEVEEKMGNLGLRELIGSGEDSGNGRILHRNLNAGSPRKLVHSNRRVLGESERVRLRFGAFDLA